MKDMNALRRNLRAVSETRQITNAMFLLSSSRMKRALNSVEYNRSYLHRIRAAVKDILQRSPEYAEHDFLTHHHSGERAVLLITSDKGMCGGYNVDVVNEAMRSIRPQDTQLEKPPLVECIGLCGSDLLKERGILPDVEWFVPSLDPALYYAKQIGEHLADMYRRSLVDEVLVVYTDYEGPLHQTVKTIPLLPLRSEDFANEESVLPYSEQMLYEPSEEAVFENLIVEYAVGIVYEAINLSLASEHCERRTAMQSATDNADSMLKELTVQCNQARQLAITNEITEIAAASAIIEKAI